MARFKPGDRVKVVQREMTTADVKSALFYDYFSNLTGAVARVYDDGTATIRVDMQSLPADIRKRHHEVEGAVRKRWMNGLSEENRDRVAGKEGGVKLEYNILVSMADLLPSDQGPAPEKPRAASAKPEPATPKAEAPEAKTEKAAGTPARGSGAAKSKEHRLTEDEIAKAEEEYLKKMAAKIK